MLCSACPDEWDFRLFCPDYGHDPQECEWTVVTLAFHAPAQSLTVSIILVVLFYFTSRPVLLNESIASTHTYIAKKEEQFPSSQCRVTQNSLCVSQKTGLAYCLLPVFFS